MCATRKKEKAKGKVQKAKVEGDTVPTPTRASVRVTALRSKEPWWDVAENLAILRPRLDPRNGGWILLQHLTIEQDKPPLA
jgi:hypothetical protein